MEADRDPRTREELLRDTARQREELAAANEQIAELTREVGRLAMLVAAGNERLTELLAAANRAQRGPRKGAAPEPLPPPSLSEEQRAAFENRPRPPAKPKKNKREKKKQRPTGRKPLPSQLPAEEHTVEPDCCSACASTRLEAADEIMEEKLHVVAAHLRRRVVRRKTKRCKDCGERTTARSLPSPFARSKATCEFLGWLVHQKFTMLSPLDRVRRDLATKGVKLSMSYLVSQIERVADMLGPIDGEHWRQLLAGSWMATDATGLKVLVPGLEKAHNGYIEVFHDQSRFVFQYEAHKGSEPLESKLGAFRGTILADAEHRYNGLFESGAVVEAACNAHPRRALRDAEVSQPALAKEAGSFVGAMFGAEEEAARVGLAGPDLLKWRREKIAPLKDALQRWMDAVEPSLPPDDAVAKIIRYYRNHWDALFRFLEDPEIPLDNSASERAFQHIAKLRLNSLFAGSTEGAHRAAVLLGISATCRALGLDAAEYIAWALTRLGTHRNLYNLSPAELTPAAYKKSLEPT